MSAARIAVVTGASSGIGLETAKALAAAGWRVIGVGRDPDRSAAALADIRAAAKDGEADMLRADLSLMSDTARLAKDIEARTDHIDVLLNNAGGTPRERVVTSEGNEATFTGNHLGHFLLTNRLLPLLRRAAADAPPGGVRIINTSSDGSEMIPGLNWADLQLLDNFKAGYAYCQGKLANVMFARGLASRLAGDGIVAHAVHPGTVASNFVSHADESTQAHIRSLAAMSPESAAEALVWLATDEEPGRTSGGYFHQSKPARPNPVAEDDAAVERLWAESIRLVEGAGARL